MANKNKRHNPFEIPKMKLDKPLRILILTDSLHEKIINWRDNIFANVQKLSEFDEIDIYFSPTSNPELKKLVDGELQCNYCDYIINEEFASIVCKNNGSTKSVVVKAFQDIPNVADLFELIADGNINIMEVEMIRDLSGDLCRFNLFDLIVCEQRDLEKIYSYDNTVVICIESMMEKIS